MGLSMIADQSVPYFLQRYHYTTHGDKLTQDQANLEMRAYLEIIGQDPIKLKALISKLSEVAGAEICWWINQALDRLLYCSEISLEDLKMIIMKYYCPFEHNNPLFAVEEHPTPKRAANKILRSKKWKNYRGISTATLIAIIHGSKYYSKTKLPGRAWSILKSRIKKTQLTAEQLMQLSYAANEVEDFLPTLAYDIREFALK